VRDPAGNDFGFSGEYRQIVPHERLVYNDRLAEHLATMG